MARLLYRQLGDGAAVFDKTSWQTHILTPAAAIIFEVFTEACDGESVATSRAIELLKEDLDVDPGSPEIQQVLRSLREMGMLAG